MLIRLTKYSIAGKRSYGDAQVIINTDYLTELQTHAIGSQFLFLEQPWDRKRARKHEWVVYEAPRVIRNAMNQPYIENIISLDVFPDNDVTLPTYRTHYQIRGIVKVYPYAQNKDYSWVLFTTGRKLLRLLVDEYWQDFIGLARTGSTSTTTSSTSTSSTSSTSTSSTSSTSTYTTNTSTSSSTTLP